MSKSLAKNKGIRLSVVNRKHETKDLIVVFGEATLELTYNRSKYTPKFEKELKRLMDESLPMSMLASMLFTLVTDWNLVDVIQTPENLAKPEDEQEVEKLPLTREVFEEALSGEALATIVEALAEDNRPNPKSSDFTKDS